MQRRTERLCRGIRDLGADAYWVVAPVNVRYLCGFTGQDSTLLVTADGHTVLVTDSRFAEQARREADVEDVVCRSGRMTAAVAEGCGDLDVRRLAVTASRVSHGKWCALGDAAPELERQASDEGVPEQLRARKSEAEIEAIRRAIEVNENAFRRWLRWLEPGETEERAAARLEYEQRLCGAEGPSFETICASGPRGSMPHARTGPNELQEGSALLVDWGARVDGYCSDLTRTLSVGKMPQKTRELRRIASEAQAAALDTLGPDVPAARVDEAAREVIRRHGYGDHIAHSCGHGVGLEVHEAPRLSVKRDETLKPGMVVTVEPGIYIEGEAGARVEDIAVVTEEGCRVLSSLEQSPEEVARSQSGGMPST